MDLAELTARTCLNGLHLTPDLWMFTIATGRDTTVKAVVDSAVHHEQPTTESYVYFVRTMEEIWNLDTPLFGTLYGHAMLGSSLAITNTILRRGFFSVADALCTLHLNTIKAPNQSRYPRIVPHALAEMQIPDAERVTAEMVWRVITQEPWCGWMAGLRAQLARMTATLANDLAMELAADLMEQAPPLKKDKSPDRLAKKVLKRSSRQLERLFGTQALRTFLKSGEPPYTPLVVEGKRYVYHLNLVPNSLIERSVDIDTAGAPVSVTICNNHSAELCEVCAYFPSLPILDHVILFLLAARNEETENDFINAMHVLLATNAFYDDPVLPELKGITDPVTAPQVFVENLFYNARSDWNEQRSAFFKQHRHLIIDAFCEIMHWPRRYLRLFRRSAKVKLDAYLYNEPEAVMLVNDARRVLMG